jgi:hypothetical protein
MGFDRADWRKSTHSCVNGCVEVAFLGDKVGVRDSKDRIGAVLVFDFFEWQAFIVGVRAGEFEFPDEQSH